MKKQIFIKTTVLKSTLKKKEIILIESFLRYTKLPKYKTHTHIIEKKSFFVVNLMMTNM